MKWEVMNKKLSRIGRVLLGVSLSVSLVGVSDASAAKVKKPGQAKIVKATSVSFPKKKTINLTFVIELPASNGGSAITSSVVSGGPYSCTMKKTAKTCTIKNVAWNAVHRYSVISKNKVGAGPKSDLVKIWRTLGKWLRTGYSPQGIKYPAAVTKIGNSRVISTQSVKWSKFQAIKRSGVASATIRRPQIGPNDVIFQTSNAVGIALPATGATGSGLLAVNRDGTVVDAVSNGTAPVQDFYSAPNNRVYVTFRTATALSSGATPCILAEINPDTGVPTCVDSELSSVRLTPTLFGRGNNPVQFDAAGNIYYLGTLNVGGGSPKQVLRKYVNGAVISLINDNITINDFVVLPDGSTLLYGITASTNATWLRKLSPAGGLSTISNSVSIYFMRKFADGNIYIGQFANGGASIIRWMTATSQIDPKPWTSSIMNSDAHFNVGYLCWQNSSKYQGFCSGSGISITAIFNFGSARTLATVGNGGASGSNLFQFFPTVEATNTILKNVTLAISVNNKLILAGLNESGVNSLTVYDPETDQETVVVDQTNEVEVYNLTYIASTNRIMFNGLRFSDNRFVLGEVEMP
jgi:hypothetical protein